MSEYDSVLFDTIHYLINELSHLYKNREDWDTEIETTI